MSRAKFEMAYDGSALQNHAIDVQHLAPALMALGNLVRDANLLINGERIKVNVLVQSDFEAKCFNISFEVVQTLVDQLLAVLEDDKVRSAKDILEWLGLLAVPAASVIGYWRWKSGRAIKNVTRVVDAKESGNVIVETNDGGQITVNRNVYILAENPDIKKAADKLFKPLEEEGFETLEFRRESSDPNEPARAVKYDKNDARQIRASCANAGNDNVEKEYEPQVVVAHLRVHAPVFDPKAEKWRFRYGEEPIYVDITDTSIAQDAIDRGGVMVDDVYKVKLVITEHEAKGGFRNSYKIAEVLEFIPAARQTGLFDWPGGPSQAD